MLRLTKYLLIILIYSAEILPQQIAEGTYLLQHEKNRIYLENRQYTFTSDGKFELYCPGDAGLLLGHGVYFLTSDKLTLIYRYYEQPTDTNVSSYSIDSNSYNSDDSLTIKLLIKDQQGPAYNAIVTLIDTSGKYVKNPLNGKYIRWSANENGMSEIKLVKRNLPVRLLITYVGYHTILIDIADTSNKTISVRLAYGFGPEYVSAGTVYTYDIKDVSEDGFYCKQNYERGWQYFCRKK